MEDVRRLQVTMVGWNQTDEFVITASNDKCLRVWDSCTGELKQILRGHEDNAYVIEAHPQEARLLLTAAHDGESLLLMTQPLCPICQAQTHAIMFSSLLVSQSFCVVTNQVTVVTNEE